MWSWCTHTQRCHDVRFWVRYSRLHCVRVWNENIRYVSVLPVCGCHLHVWPHVGSKLLTYRCVCVLLNILSLYVNTTTLDVLYLYRTHKYTQALARRWLDSHCAISGCGPMSSTLKTTQTHKNATHTSDNDNGTYETAMRYASVSSFRVFTLKSLSLALALNLLSMN